MINSIPTIRTIMALRGEKLIIDLGKTFTGTLTAWMKKDPNDKTYRSFSILSNRYLVLSQDRAKDYYDINDILLESIEGKWFFDVEQLDTGGTVGVDEKTVFTGTIQFINDITGSDGIETIPSPIIDNILRLVDTPSVYGTTTQILQMNAGGTALEWADASGGVSSLPDLADVVSATNTNKFVLVANGSTGYVGRALVEADISDLQSYLTVESDTLQDVTGRGSTTDQNIQVPSLSFNTASVVDVIQGQLAWNADEETLDLGLNGAVLQLGQEVHYHVKNSSGEDISDGDAIMAVGTLGASGRILVAKMVNDGTVEPYFFLGIATEAIGNDTEGKITHFGKVRGIQTDGDNYSETWLDGDLLYINSTIAGRLTNVEPQAPSHKSPIAIVLDAHASNGTISVRVSLNQGIHESHDVQISSSLNNDFLKYNLSLKRWENGQLVEADISDFGSYLTSETSHADVLVDGDFATAGLMKTDGAGNYSILTDNSSNWNTAYTHSQLVVGNPHAVTKAEVGLGNVPNIDTTNASNITTGTLPSSVIPPVALTSVQTANSEVNMLLLTTEEGDVVVRTDQPSKSWMHNGGIAGTMADFTELQTPTDSVLSVNSQTGTVVLTTTHINEGTNLYYTEGRVSANTSVAANTAKTSFPGFTSLITDYGFTDNSGNWNTAHGWGDHSGLYSVLAHTHTFASLTSKPTTLSGYGISDSKANFNSALSDGTFLYVGDVTTFPGWGSITDHTDIVSATNTDKFVLVANGSTGYVGRALLEADISDFGSYNNYVHPNHTGDSTSTADGATVVVALRGIGLDSTVSSPVDGKILVYRSAGGDWILEDKPVPGGGGATQLSELSDVTNVAYTNRHVLVADGVDYDSRALVEADISDFGSYLATGITTLSGYGISDSKANFNSALSDGTFLYVGDVTTFPGWGSITDHTDVVSATNTNKFVLVANGSTGYVGRALLEADISDFGSYLTSETSHADVLVDGDFGTAGLMKTDGAGNYSIITDNSSTWDALVSNVTTNLTFSRNSTTVTVESSDGNNAILPEANTTQAGILGSDKWDEIVANSLKVSDVNHNITTDISFSRNATTLTVISSDGNNAILPEADTTNAGILGSDKWDEIVANSLKVTFPGWGSITDHTDVVSATNTNKFVLVANGSTGYVGRALVEADINDFGSYATSGHTHSAFDRATSVLSGATVFSDIIVTNGITTGINTRALTLADLGLTGTAAEYNILDLGGLTAGWVYSADSANTASWKAPTGGGDVATDVIWDAIGDLAIGSGANTSVRLARGTANQVLTVNAGGTNIEWKDSSGGGATELVDLSDVDSAAKTNKFVLAADGANYVGRALVLDDISDYPTSIEAYITDAPTKALLDGTGNWDIDGAYTGTAITGTFQGQKHFNTAYFFEAVDDNDWIRLPRG